MIGWVTVPLEPSRIEMSLQWPEDLPDPAPVNQYAIQLLPGADGAPEEMLVTLGHVTGPILLGTAQDQAEQMSRAGTLTIRASGRITLSRARAEQLAKALLQATEAWDAALSSRSQGGAQ